MSTSDFFADAGIGPDTIFCVHRVFTRYQQTIHSLLSSGGKRSREVVPNPRFSSRLNRDFRPAIQAPWMTPGRPG